VVAPPQDEAGPVAADRIDKLLRTALATASLKDAVEAVSVATGQPRRLVYQRALALAKDSRDDRA